MEAIKQIINVLKTDDTVTAQIGNRIYPFHTSDTSQDCIVYTPVPLEDNKVKETWRIEITIITKQLANAYAIDNAIRNALLTLGDEALTEGILKVALNGGGMLYNYETHTYHNTGYYYLVVRK